MGLEEIKSEGKAVIKHWTSGVEFEHAAREQLDNIASLPFIHSHIAVMPDVHMGRGATVGSVIPTKGAIVPAAVGVDIGCGMVALQLDVKASRLPDNLRQVRAAIEQAVPHGFSSANRDHTKGGWVNPTNPALKLWRDKLSKGYDRITNSHKSILKKNVIEQLGTLGGSNHFIEVCLDNDENVWLMLHSGSRGVGNKIGSYFIDKARREMERHNIHLPDRDLAYITEGSELFDDYWHALSWAQEYARINRDLMMDAVVDACRKHIPVFSRARKLKKAINCHHNYVSLEPHFDEQVFVTRKGAVSAARNELGIIPGSMGARSYIVRGLGNPESFNSCSHGAGRRMSRGQARRTFTEADHVEATKGIECRKDSDVIDETPGAYKSVEAVMAAQSDLVEVVSELRQVVCVKG